MEIRPFTPADHAAAARLVAAGYRRLRRLAPALPDGWEDSVRFEAELKNSSPDGAAWAAVRGDRLVGHFGGFVNDWGAGPVTWTPEWAWSAGDSRRTTEQRRIMIHDLYTMAAEGWEASGPRSHWVSVYANDRGAIDAFTWLGFGHHVVNAVRTLDPVPPRADAQVRVREAGAADVPFLQALEDGLRDHLTQSPTLLPLAPRRSAEEQRRRIEEPQGAVLLAEMEGDVVGHLLIGPSADDIATIVQDEHTASISGAFVRVDVRRRGVAETLLGAGIEWARAGGYRRVGVDFESANTAASRFWLRSFVPVTFFMVRRLPGRTAP